MSEEAEEKTEIEKLNRRIRVVRDQLLRDILLKYEGQGDKEWREHVEKEILPKLQEKCTELSKGTPDFAKKDIDKMFDKTYNRIKEIKEKEEKQKGLL